jgi:hypothetical protein
MTKAIDGSMIFHATRPGRLPERDRGDYYERQGLRELPMVKLRNRLCALGPVKCAECGLCEYGKEYARRKREGA